MSSQPTTAEAASRDDPALRLLDVARELAVELHPDRAPDLIVGLDSHLDRDLGLDSLGRAELMLRLERAFAIALPESLLSDAETTRDLLTALLETDPRARQRRWSETRPLALGPATAAPADAATLVEVLDWHIDRHPDRPHIILAEESGAELTISYNELGEGARALARGLRRHGVEPGERVAIMLPTGAAFFRTFFAILYAGAIPVPIYPPMSLARIEDHLRRQAAILNNAGATILITVPEGRRLAALLKALIGSLRAVETADDLEALARVPAPDDDWSAAPGGQDIALLQYTSGSTGDPKGVVLSHANLLANIRAMGRVMDVDSSDVFISWLPLYHDMGLIGAWLGSLYFAVPVVILSPLNFLARPHIWLWAIHRHRGTLSAAPNFAFELCLSKIDAHDLEGLDLGSLRLLANGAEPVSVATIRRLSERLAPFGFRPQAMAPVYGLAECSVGLAFPPPGRAPLIDRIARDALSRGGEAVPAADSEAAIEIVACGRPLPGHQIRIVDATGREVEERREGRLQFRGPSTTAGYYRSAEKTRELFDGEWLESGDLAYVAGGDIYLTGRVKDIIIRAGRNIYPHEVEQAVGEVDGVRKGSVAVFASPEPGSAAERIVVVAETREMDGNARRELRQRIDIVATDLLQAPVDEIVLAPPRSVPKTSSGKIRRTASRDLYRGGRFGAAPRPWWWQLARLAGATLAPSGRRWRGAAGAALYAAYWWGVVGLVGGVTWPVVVALPSRAARWSVVRAVARIVLRLTGARLSVFGRDHLVPGGAVLVANHASYLDGLALIAALPGETAFAVKHELAERFFAGLFLRRLGALFVERFDVERGIADTAHACSAAAAGARLLFFPEGTLTRRPGLLDFRLGAFLVAAEAGVPVVPVTLHGTRSILRGNQWFPRRGTVAVEVAPAVAPEGNDFAAALRLRDAARAAILSRCGEPDLAGEGAPVFAPPAD